VPLCFTVLCTPREHTAPTPNLESNPHPQPHPQHSPQSNTTPDPHALQTISYAAYNLLWAITPELFPTSSRWGRGGGAALINAPQAKNIECRTAKTSPFKLCHDTMLGYRLIYTSEGEVQTLGSAHRTYELCATALKEIGERPDRQQQTRPAAFRGAATCLARTHPLIAPTSRNPNPHAATPPPADPLPWA
jgi:hypothetical protein